MAEILITSSVLIAGLCLLRALLKGRISPLLQYGMWSVAAIHLTIPMFYPIFGWLKIAWPRKPASAFSVMNAAGSLRDMAASRPAIEPLVNNLASGQVVRYDNPATIAQMAAGIDWQTIILTVWAVGGLLLFMWMAWTNFRFSRSLYMRRERYAGDTRGITSLPVYQAQGLRTPCFMAYLGDRAIYLPAGMNQDEEKMRHILIHEDCHNRHHDQLWSALRCVLLCYYWVNPLVWVAAFLSKRDCELACDAAAVKRLGEGERTAYAMTLIDLTVKPRPAYGFLNVSSDLWNGKKAMKERITLLARHPKTTKAAACFIVLALTALTACTYTGQKAQNDIEASAKQWAQAFCGRDGRALLKLYSPEHPEDFYEMPQVQSLPEDDFVSFGWSSPWPMDQAYEISSQGNRSEITYYAMTSDPHRWVWKESLIWKKTGGVWYVDQEQFKEYDGIVSAEEFREAYSQGIAKTAMDYRTGGMADALNELAETDPVYQNLLQPQTAMEFLLNLRGGTGAAIEQNGAVTAVYTFADGSMAAAEMVRPAGNGGIWIPVDVVQVPTGLPENGAAGSTSAVTAEDAVRLAGVTDVDTLAGLTVHFPAPDSVDGAEEKEVQNLVEHYVFSHQNEPYELQISFDKTDKTLFYVGLQRLNTGEWLNIYQTEDALETYGITLAGEDEIRSFFATHKSMDDYLTYRLPGELTESVFLQALGNGGGGNLLLTSDDEGQKRLDDLSRYVDQSAVPPEWRAAGAAARYTGVQTALRFTKGELTEVGLPWNHAYYLTEPVPVPGCEAPALLALVSHDMYTVSGLEDVEAAHGPVPEENQTSRMWYVFFARPDCDEMYAISLNADLYRDTDLLEIARSAHFTKEAWTGR